MKMTKQAIGKNPLNEYQSVHLQVERKGILHEDVSDSSFTQKEKYNICFGANDIFDGPPAIVWRFPVVRAKLFHWDNSDLVYGWINKDKAPTVAYNREADRLPAELKKEIDIAEKMLEEILKQNLDVFDYSSLNSNHNRYFGSYLTLTESVRSYFLNVARKFQETGVKK